jgi:tRNA threonylcarbamoyladenosine biosynthesis protein TsaB
LSAILGVDTSGAIAGVAVYDQRVLAEITWRSGRQHSRTLLACVGRVLELSGKSRADLGAIAMANGPGSYSGLRVGASTAVGLGLALDVPVLRVPTLDVIAYTASPGAGRVLAAIDVGRGRYAATSYVRDELGMEAMSEIESATFDELVARAIGENALLIGDFSLEELERRGRVRVATNAAGMRRAGYLTELAARTRSDSGPVAEAGQLIYLTP